MRIATAACFLLLMATTAFSAPDGEKPKKPVHSGVGRAITYPVRHPLKFQKAIGTATKKVAQAIW